MLNGQDVEWEEWYDRVESKISEIIKGVIENEKANSMSRLHQDLPADAGSPSEA